MSEERLEFSMAGSVQLSIPFGELCLSRTLAVVSPPFSERPANAGRMVGELISPFWLTVSGDAGPSMCVVAVRVNYKKDHINISKKTTNDWFKKSCKEKHTFIKYQYTTFIEMNAKTLKINFQNLNTRWEIASATNRNKTSSSPSESTNQVLHCTWTTHISNGTTGVLY